MPINDSRILARTSKAAVVHKVIDITPQGAPSPGARGKRFSAWSDLPAQFGPLMHRYGTAALSVTAAILLAAILFLLVHSHSHRSAGTAPAHPAAPAAPLAAAKSAVPAQAKPRQPVLVELNLPTALQQGLVECLWRGNGKDRLFMDARNASAQPLRLHLPAGQLLASVDSTIVVLQPQTLDLPPHAELHREFPTVATSSANRVIGAEYHLSSGALPDLDKLFSYYQAHPGTPPAALQTAALILTENLPLSAFAKFNELSAGASSVPESQDFKADTGDILSALAIVREIGIDRPLAVTIDPQLEVEAMIDPNSHALALSYYNISDEWAFWKNQLLQGDPSTRHYALYGIARYYPDIALQMLPKWARGESISPVYRLSAVEALAQTDRAEAIPILRELEREFGGTSDLGHAAHVAANFLDAQFAHANTGPVLESNSRHLQPALASAGN